MTETQILMLNNLIYDPVFTAEGAEAFSVGELLEFVDTDAYQKQEGMAGPATTREEWENLLALARGDEELCSLRIVERKNNPATGAKALCFYSEKEEEAFVVFAGTGYNEWRDDLVAGAESDTRQQTEALEWFEALPYEKITVSGHSKGGNKAMYVAVCSDKAPMCIAFDGEGFSREFLEKYREKIEERKGQIVLYANYRDFVSCLLYPIAGTVIFLENDGGISAEELGFGGYHCPDTLFLHRDGKILYELARQGKREPAIELIQEFTIYFMEKAPKAERVQLLSFLGDIMQRLMGQGEYRNDIFYTIAADGLRDVLIYLQAFLNEKKREDLTRYLCQICSLANLLEEFAGLPAIVKPLLPFLLSGAAEQKMLSFFIHLAAQTGQTLTVRDFTQETRERTIEAAREVEKEEVWRISRWDCWYQLEEVMVGLDWSRYVDEIEVYYRKLIDLNDAGVREIERIFDEVQSIDSLYAEKIAAENERIREGTERIKRLGGHSNVRGGKI